jgi:hypothetical protein
MIEPRTLDGPVAAPRKRKEREDDDLIIDSAIDAFGLDEPDDAEPDERRRDPLRRR